MGEVTLLQTGRFYEANMLAEALREAGVPYYQEAMTSTGLRYAMFPLDVHGPGQLYHVLVPEEAAEDARAIMQSLPIMEDDMGAVWGEEMPPWGRRALQAVIMMILFLYLYGMAINVLGLFSR